MRCRLEPSSSAAGQRAAHGSALGIRPGSYPSLACSDGFVFVDNRREKRAGSERMAAPSPRPAQIWLRANSSLERSADSPRATEACCCSLNFKPESALLPRVTYFSSLLQTVALLRDHDQSGADAKAVAVMAIARMSIRCPNRVRTVIAKNAQENQLSTSGVFA